jgi:cytochrome c oxidase subunit II
VVVLQGLYDRKHEFVEGPAIDADANYIRESILIPRAKVVAGYAPVMPSYKGQLSDDDIASIIAYLETLSTKSPSSASATPAAAAAN